MGRKSLAAERKEDILNAFEQCILERGIEGTSFVPKNQFQTAVHTIATLLERSSMFQWLGVKEVSVKSVKAAIEKVLESLE